MKIYKYGLASIFLMIIGFAIWHYQGKDEVEHDYSVSYVESENNKDASTAADKTPEQVDAEEGIDAEQIVVEITDDGYVTSHGDHYHFYNGKVPYDAILSEELLVSDDSYAFAQERVVSEVLDGYIVRLEDESYALYLKPGSSRQNIRTKAEIEAAMNQ